MAILRPRARTTVAKLRRNGTAERGLAVAAVFTIAFAGVARAVSLDQAGEMKLGVRTYSGIRIGSEDTDIEIDTNPVSGRQTFRSLTFPVSSAGHVRQHRLFVEAELDHDLERLFREGVGPFALLNHLPFEFRRFKYHLVYRGEYEGIYDYGPSEYRTSEQYRDQELAPCFSGRCPTDPSIDGGPSVAFQTRERLRDKGVLRNRLFQAYLETQVGELVLRFGRQILVWGETDAFRLLDNINPIDNGFGGFLIPLDERRVPLDMLVANYYLGELGPLFEAYLEGYVAIDDAVAYRPGLLKGSAWTLPNLGEPNMTQFDSRSGPARSFEDARGGVQFKFNAPLPGVGDTTFGLAHYYTYVDSPQVQSYVGTNFPLAITEGTARGFQAWTIQRAPRVQISGATSTFAIPVSVARHVGLGGEPIVRTELAYFHGEPRHTQSQLDPFVYDADGECPSGTVVNGLCSGGRNEGDSWNFVLGLDLNQYIRFLNPRQSFFLSAQFFYKHLRGATPQRRALTADGRDLGVEEREVIPVPAYKQAPVGLSSGANQSVLALNPTDQFLQTLLISTSYLSGQLNPSLTLFYDWGGSFAAIPQVTLSRDPFRFTLSYNFIEASSLKGGSGVSLLRDRDNVLLQVEYVL